MAKVSLLAGLGSAAFWLSFQVTARCANGYKGIRSPCQGLMLLAVLDEMGLFCL